MRNLVYGLLAAVLGLGLIILILKYIAEECSNKFDYRFEATYFLEVPQHDFEGFSLSLFRYLKEVRSSGYIMGTSDMVTIKANGRCGDDRKLEKYLSEYVKGNQYVCFMTGEVR